MLAKQHILLRETRLAYYEAVLEYYDIVDSVDTSGTLFALLNPCIGTECPALSAGVRMDFLLSRCTKPKPLYSGPSPVKRLQGCLALVLAIFLVIRLLSQNLTHRHERQF
jgi:hypothetical protein